MEDEIYKLSELDKVEKNGSISNNDSKIAGIIDKSIRLTTSSHTKLSFMKDKPTARLKVAINSIYNNNTKRKLKI